MNIINLGGRVVNTYIYEIKDGYVMIDTGYEKGYKKFKNKLKKNNIELKDIKYIFLTHAHDDHAGFLNAILNEQPELKLVVSSRAIEGLRRGQNSFKGGCTSRQGLMFCKLLALLGKGDHQFPPIEKALEKRLLMVTHKTKEDLEKKLEAKIIETPGHTVCSLSLLLPNGILFTGDAAMNGFPSKHRITIWAEDKKVYYRTWKKIIGLEPETLYPTHGKPFSIEDIKKYLPKAKEMKAYKLK